MRLIDADNLKAELFDANWLTDNDEHMVEKIVERQSTVDAEPVRSAVWRRKDKDQALFGVEWECTNCHESIALNGILTPIGNGFKFCPYCGAKMKGCEQG